MDKITKILLYAVLAVVVIHALYNLIFSHSLLKDAVNDIKGVKNELKMVSDSLSSSRQKIGEVMQHLEKNQEKIGLMKKEVEILYLNYQKGNAKSAAEVKILKSQLDDEQQGIDSLKKQLSTLD